MQCKGDVATAWWTCASEDTAWYGGRRLRVSMAMLGGDVGMCPFVRGTAARCRGSRALAWSISGDFVWPASPIGGRSLQRDWDELLPNSSDEPVPWNEGDGSSTKAGGAGHWVEGKPAMVTRDRDAAVFRQGSPATGRRQRAYLGEGAPHKKREEG